MGCDCQYCRTLTASDSEKGTSANFNGIKAERRVDFRSLYPSASGATRHRWASATSSGTVNVFGSITARVGWVNF